MPFPRIQKFLVGVLLIAAPLFTPGCGLITGLLAIKTPLRINYVRWSRNDNRIDIYLVEDSSQLARGVKHVKSYSASLTGDNLILQATGTSTTGAVQLVVGFNLSIDVDDEVELRLVDNYDGLVLDVLSPGEKAGEFKRPN